MEETIGVLALSSSSPLECTSTLTWHAPGLPYRRRRATWAKPERSTRFPLPHLRSRRSTRVCPSRPITIHQLMWAYPPSYWEARSCSCVFQGAHLSCGQVLAIWLQRISSDNSHFGPGTCQRRHVSAKNGDSRSVCSAQLYIWNMHSFALMFQQTSNLNVKAVQASSVSPKMQEIIKKAPYSTKSPLSLYLSIFCTTPSTSIFYLYVVYLAPIIQLHFGSHIEAHFIWVKYIHLCSFDVGIHCEKSVNMIMFGLHTSCQIILGLAVYTSTSASHKLDKKIADLSPAFESFHDSVYSRDANKNDSTYDNSYAGPDLSKRGLYNLGQNSPSDVSILQQAYLDMVQVVTFVAANPNPQAMARYFSPADAADVTAIFNTVRLMAQPGGFPNPPADVLPIWKDLSDITVVHTNGIKELGTLAESDSTAIGITTGQIINVYDFGWTALWQRLLGDLQCARDIGPKTNYKMHFLGTLLLHETL